MEYYYTSWWYPRYHIHPIFRYPCRRFLFFWKEGPPSWHTTSNLQVEINSWKTIVQAPSTSNFLSFSNIPSCCKEWQILININFDNFGVLKVERREVPPPWRFKYLISGQSTTRRKRKLIDGDLLKLESIDHLLKRIKHLKVVILFNLGSLARFTLIGLS